ncbi:MAG: peptidyl-prolyl cis-trans isomerase [Balneolales bacterium]
MTSCIGQDVENGDHLIAEVQGKKLTLNEVRDNIPANIYERDSVATIQKYRKNWINRQLMLQEGKRLELDKKPGVLEKLQKAEEEVLTTALIDLVQKEIREEGITYEEAQNYYENYRDQFTLKEEHVRYRHLIAESMSAAQNAKNALQRGISWEEVARRYSVDPEEAIQNSTQFYPTSTAAIDYGSMNPYLQIIGITEISPISEENGNFHFVQLREERREGEHPDLEWVLDQIKKWLLVEKQRRNIKAYERNLYLKAESNNEIKLYDVHNLEKAKEIQSNLESDTITSY